MANRAVGLMPKREFIRQLAAKLDVTQSTAELMMVACEETILEGLQSYNKVKFADLVTFTKQEVSERVYRLPGEEQERVCEAHTRIVPDMVEGNRRFN